MLFSRQVFTSLKSDQGGFVFLSIDYHVENEPLFSHINTGDKQSLSGGCANFYFRILHFAKAGAQRRLRERRGECELAPLGWGDEDATGVEELNSSPGDENTSRVPEIHQDGQGSRGGREAEREKRRTSALLAVVNKLISIRQIPLLTVTSLLQEADPGMGGLVRGACDGLGGGGHVTNC